MMTASDYTNSPRSVRISGRDLSIKELGVGQIAAHCERLVRDEYYQHMRTVAEMADGKERTAILLEMQKNVPDGIDLIQKASEMLIRKAGISSVCAHAISLQSDMTYDDALKLVMSADDIEYVHIAKTVLGDLIDFADKTKPADPEPEGPEDSEKKTN